MKILITGGTGFIGANLISKLYQKYDITALTRIGSNTEKIKGFCKIFSYDYQINHLISLFQQECFDGVIHLATHYQATHSSSDLTTICEANITLGTHLLESCRYHYPKFFINTLTFSQFANSKTYSPPSLYDATKQAFYDLICFYQSQIPTLFSHLLLYNTYGPNDPRPKIFNLWQKYALSQEILEMSQGEQELDFSHIDDVINGFDLLIQLILKNKIPKNTIHTLQNTRYQLRELADLYMSLTKTNINIKWGAKPYRSIEIFKPIGIPDLPILPEWKPKISLQKGIQQIYGK